MKYLNKKGPLPPYKASYKVLVNTNLKFTIYKDYLQNAFSYCNHKDFRL